MAASDASKICPRCNAVLPGSASFCGDCGYQLTGPAPQATPSLPQDAPTQLSQPDGASLSNNAASQPGEPAASGELPQDATQPGYLSGYEPQNQPEYSPPPPPTPPAYAGYPVPPAAAPPRRGGAAKWVAALLVLIVVLGGLAAAWLLYLSPSHPGSPFFDRHGLQSNVPLPSNSAFMVKKSISQIDPTTNTTLNADAWTWTVSGSDPTAVQQFYHDNLPKNGWNHLQSFSGQNGEQDLTACQGNQVLIVGTGKKIEVTDDQGKVTKTIIAPSGGAALATEVSSAQELVHLFCSNG